MLTTVTHAIPREPLGPHRQTDTTNARLCVVSRDIDTASVFYEAASVLEAVDAAFKSMFVLALKYPAPAHSS